MYIKICNNPTGVKISADYKPFFRFSRIDLIYNRKVFHGNHVELSAINLRCRQEGKSGVASFGKKYGTKTSPIK